MKSKAIFLLLTFLLNTVVGFGCALGMEVDRHDETHVYLKTVSHIHKDHDHHHADEAQQKASPASELSFLKENLCCKTLVNDLVTQSKLVPESGKVQVALPVLWLPDYSYALLIPAIDVKLDRSFYVDRRERPPNKDIRIVIQSFQI